ncbi:E3 ubiquitin-protein ligase rad18 [Ascosphaera pollenicola]|nr:E3 ubiquitin-protein ligase rad18 [Ascosphaera pollenicola]
MADSSFDIPDTTDWLSTPLHKLSALEAALRCQVCKDFFTNPVITSCSHTFCSLCIRRCLSVEGKCPACRSSDQPSKLRCNWVVQEAVDGWVQARKEVLDAARQVGRPRDAEGERIQDGLSPGIKRGPDEEHQHEQPTESSDSKKRLRSSTRSRSVTYAYEDTMTQFETSPMDGTYVPDVEVIASASALPPPSNPEPNDGLVPCPICTRRMKPTLVFSHLDRCPGPPPQGQNHLAASQQFAQSPRRSPFAFNSNSGSSPPSLKRLPALNYTLMNDRELRRKMSALGISSTGPRPLLQRRHTEWINLWNANCDSRNPKSKRELLQELDLWERSQGSMNGHGSVNKLDVSRKDFDKENWGKGHQDSFKDLIEQARRGRNKKTSTRPETEDNAGSVDPMSLDGTPAPPTPVKPQIPPTTTEPEQQSAFAQSTDPIEIDTPRAPALNSKQVPPTPAHISNPQARFAYFSQPSNNMAAGTVAYRPPYQQQPTTLSTPMSFAQSVDPIENGSPQWPQVRGVAQSPQTLPGNPSYGNVAMPSEGRHQQQGQGQNGMPAPTPISFAQSVDPIEPDPLHIGGGNTQQPSDAGSLYRVPGTPLGESADGADAQGIGSDPGNGTSSQNGRRRSRRRSSKKS